MNPEPLFEPADVRHLVGSMGQAIATDHPDGVVVIAVLKAAVIFAADLVRELARRNVDVRLDFIETSSFQADSGRIRLVQDLREDISGRSVVLVTTLVDTGFRLAYLIRQIEARDPASLRVGALFDKTDRRILPVELDYVGTVVPDRFLVGYGLDTQGRGRNVDAVATLADETSVDDVELARWMAASRRAALSQRDVGG